MNILEKIVANFQNRDELPFVVIGNGDNEFYINYLSGYFNKVNYFVVKGGNLGTQLDSLGLPFLSIVNRNGDQINLVASLPIREDFSVIDKYLQKWIKWCESDFEPTPANLNQVN
ncbi:MAG: hypothetical protein D4R64_05670 [Porphyromonadaceae bacterium]|nr:MAG: hypothetical protein D4R64_05670 [Porphyromonadaceae bacterium]